MNQLQQFFLDAITDAVFQIFQIKSQLLVVKKTGDAPGGIQKPLDRLDMAVNVPGADAELVAEEFASRCWYCAELAGRLHEWWTTGDDWFVNADKDREPGEDPILESERWAQATHGEKVDRVASQL